MGTEEVRGLWTRLNQFCGQFDDCIKDCRTRKHLRTYVGGQLSSLERKSVEPIALEMGTPVRTLQEFLEIHRWDDAAAARRLREIVQKRHGAENAIGVIDETSFAKKGKKTAGVQRQHCGATGKIDNCVMTVHLGFVSGGFHTLVDSDLYLPQESWAGDRERCRQAHIPEEVIYRPKWRIALDLLARTLGDGVKLRWITADEAYGRVMEFRDRVTALELLYVMEIPSDLVGWTQMPEIELAGTVTQAGGVLRSHRVSPQAEPARPVSQLWKRGGPAWQTWKIKETEKGPSVWRVRETAFHPNVLGYPGEALRLVIACEVLTGEVKYFLSNASQEIPLGEVLHVAFSRWHIERMFEDGKGEVGLDHFEVRNYRPLIRHLLLSMISFYFLADQTERLQENKLAVDLVPSENGDRMPGGPEPLAA
jgi:SRSO17 transposase